MVRNNAKLAGEVTVRKGRGLIGSDIVGPARIAVRDDVEAFMADKSDQMSQ
jgi:hypothetical protein